MDIAAKTSEDSRYPLSRASSFLPATILANSSKRRFEKLGRMPSDGSQRSGSSSSSSSRSGEGVILRPPGKTQRHLNRLSGVFLRGPDPAGPGPMALPAGLRPSLSGHLRKGSRDGPGVAEDPSELSTQKTAPGILKVFGSDICEGAHYKSVLATTHSSAKELVKEALERYGLGKEEAQLYVLCDSIGSLVGGSQWETEAFRVVGDNEKPLLLQSLWKPREGLARRFEIQRRSSVDEKRSKEKDTVTAGINAQARRLQKSRSRVTSTLIEKASGRGPSLWRSRSEMDLLDVAADPQPSPSTPPPPPCHQADHNHNHKQKQNPNSALSTSATHGWDQNNMHRGVHCLSVSYPAGVGEAGADTESLCRRGREERRSGERGERGGRGGRGESETESSDDSGTQYSIRPPRDCPYLLLLQGCSPLKEFVIYLVTGQSTVIGRGGEHGEGLKVDIPLFAPDIHARHCCLGRRCADGPTLLRPGAGALVTLNGEVLGREAELNPGDVIGLGQFYLFLFKNPSTVTAEEVNDASPETNMAGVPCLLANAKSTASTAHPRQQALRTTRSSTRCSTRAHPDCPSAKRSLTGCPQSLRDAEGHALTLTYDAESEEEEEVVVKEIVAMGNDGPALTTAFLMSVCVQSWATRRNTADLRRLLLLIAANAQSAVRVSQGAVRVSQGAGRGSQGAVRRAVLERAMAGLRPLVLWMSNGLELLHVIQDQLPLLLDWRTRREQGRDREEDRDHGNEQEEELSALLELRLACVRTASEETIEVLEKIVMLTFQQCVYYVTKVLHPILPGVLDHDPFADSPHPASTQETQGWVGGDGETQGVHEVLEVLGRTRTLLQECQVHPEVCSQLLAYLLYFINASLFNSLMERGSEAGFYQWSRGIRIRANLDVLLDWVHASGPPPGHLVPEHLHTLSSAVNLLATPRDVLLQTSWASLRADYPGLREAQLHHLLVHYTPASTNPQTWAPASPGPQQTWAPASPADILESFDTQHPLVLPGEGYHLGAGVAVTDRALSQQLGRLQDFISSLSDPPSNRETTSAKCQDRVVPAKAKRIRMAVLPRPSLEVLEDPPPLRSLPPRPAPPPVSPSPPPPPPVHGLLDDPEDLLLLSRKLQILEPGSEEEEVRGGGGGSEEERAEGVSRSPTAVASCLLTAPSTPRNMELVITEEQPHTGEEGGGARLSAQEEVQEEGSLVSEFLAALTADRRSVVGVLKEEEEEEEEAEEEEEEEEEDDLVFSLELERGERGLGLALVDARDTPLRTAGIFIRAVVPDSPAGRCEKLIPGDRILAVNGTSLLGVDLDLGKELIQASGNRPRLLVARSDWTARGLRSKC
ncbi:unnamed protein product [Lota lota]